MKVYQFIQGFNTVPNYSLNLHDQDEIVWFFGDMEDALKRIPDWCIHKEITRFNVIPVSFRNSTQYIVIAEFKD